MKREDPSLRMNPPSSIYGCKIQNQIREACGA